MEFEWRGTDYDPSQLPRFFTDRRCEFFPSRLPVLDNLSSFELLLGAAGSETLFSGGKCKLHSRINFFEKKMKKTFKLVILRSSPER